MPTSKHRKNRKPYNPVKIQQIASIKASGIPLQRLLDSGHKLGKGQVLVNRNGAPTKYWMEKDVFVGKPRKLSSILQKLRILGVNGSYKNRKDTRRPTDDINYPR